MSNKEKIWNTVIYVRLSSADGDKEESNSITNQKDLINDYLKSYENINIISTKVDDGYSGVNFERPAFLEMMEEIKKGQVNCVVVKDLSRFGRNFEQTGKYLEQIFPFLGVRFISVNDRIDSLDEKNTNDNIIIPFKNLINDAYCRDISIKIRSQLDIKRKKGDFLAPFAVYGYLKENQANNCGDNNNINKNKLVVDEYASLIVKDIFKMKIEGMSHQRISEKLNKLGVLSPMDYKKSIGLSFASPFKRNIKSKWTVVTVRRILQNEIYTGTLIQGKTSTPNHKVKKKIIKDETEWIKIENNHEPIISKEDFKLIKSLMKKDTRVTETRDKLYLLSGILTCADCGHNMIRKTVPSNGRKYTYYVCVNNKQTKQCSSHSIRVDLIERIVGENIHLHIKNLIDLKKILETIKKLPIESYDIKKIDKQLLKKKEELEKYKKYKKSLFEKFALGIIEETDYKEYKEIYTNNILEIEENIKSLNKEIDNFINKESSKSTWLEKFIKYKDFNELNREILVNLIDEILVYEDKKINIKYKYSINYKRTLELINSVNEITPLNKGVVING